MSRRHYRIGILAAGALVAALAPAAASAADFSGIWKVAAPVRGLRTTDGKAPPLLPAALAIYDAHKAAKARGDLSWDGAQICKPLGEPRAMFEAGWPFEIVQTGNRVQFLYQWNHLTRAVPLKDKQDAFNGPWYFGQSVGHFEGETLVIDTVGVSAETFLDAEGLPHSDDMHLVEHFTLRDGGKTLEVRIDIDDAATFSAPWSTTLRFTRQPAGSIAEDVCITRLRLEERYPTLPDKLYPR